MKRAFLLSIVTAVAVLGMLTMANAGSVDWQYLTHSSALNKGPGADGLMGTGDDAPDTNNTPGALSSATITWGPYDPPCLPATVTTYMTGIEVACQGNPSGQFTTTYLRVVQTETLPDTGSVTITLRPGGGPNTGNNCGLGAVTKTTDTQMVMTLGTLPLGIQTAYGMVYDADSTISSNWTCPANSIVYQASYLDSIRQLLPTAAEGFMVVCSSLTFDMPGVPCVDDAVTDGLNFLWTDDDPQDCALPCCDNDGDDYEAEGTCAGDDCLDTNPNVNPGATEKCGNSLDDDCAGDGDATCPAGSCAGGPVE